MTHFSLLELFKVAGAVVVAQGVTCVVVGDGYAVIFGQQVTPFGIAVGIFMVGSAVRGREDVAYIIVGIGVGGISLSFQQLPLSIVGIGNGAFPGLGVGSNVASGIVGVAKGDRALNTAVRQAADLGRGLGVGNIPVRVGAGVDTGFNTAQPA